MNKLKLILLIAVILIIALLIIVIIVGKTTKQVPFTPIPILTPTISPITTFAPLPTIPSSEFQHYQAEQNYAEAEKRFTQEKPWYLNLPLKTDNYFISYDTETNTFLATIYYTSTDSKIKEEQLVLIKQQVSTAITNLGLDPATQKIIYYETRK